MELKFFLQFSFCGRHRQSVSDYSTQTAHVKQLLTSATSVIYLGGMLQVIFQKILLKVQIQLGLNNPMFNMNPMKSLKTFARLNFRTACLSLHLKQF